MSKTAYDTAQAIVQQPTNQLSRPATVDLVMPARPSALKTILGFIGWTLFSAAALLAIVTLGSIWLTTSTVRDIFNLDPQTKIITGDTVIESIKQVNKQIFIEHYDAVDIDYSEAPSGWLSLLPIKQSFVVLLKGRVPAGFDLSQLSPSDVWISSDGQRVQLTLPPPEIFAENVNVDFEHSRILTQSDTCPEILCQDSLTAFQKELLPQGRKLLIQASEQSGILDQAAQDGQRYYENFLKSLGFQEVRVIVRADD